MKEQFNDEKKNTEKVELKFCKWKAKKKSDKILSEKLTLTEQIKQKAGCQDLKTR